MTKPEIDKLGERLRQGDPTDADLASLGAYRRSFRGAFARVEDTLRGLGLSFSGRAQKTPQSIIAKLRRTKLRLSRIQDIAGCRIYATDVEDRIVSRLQKAFSVESVVDRRVKPSHGYRAVHVIVSVDGILVEVQVRTELQHLWAQISEVFAGFDREIKYGGGLEGDRALLLSMSEKIAQVETGGSPTVETEAVLRTLLASLETGRRQNDFHN